MGNFLKANLAEPPVFFPEGPKVWLSLILPWFAMMRPGFYVINLPQLSFFSMGENRGRQTQICLTEVKGITETAMHCDSFPVVCSGGESRGTLTLIWVYLWNDLLSSTTNVCSSVVSIAFWGLNCNNQLLGCYLRILNSFSKEYALSVIPFPGNTKTNWFIQPFASSSWEGLPPHSWECDLWPALASHGEVLEMQNLRSHSHLLSQNLC